jgi:hypothetical protein
MHVARIFLVAFLWFIVFTLLAGLGSIVMFAAHQYLYPYVAMPLWMLFASAGFTLLSWVAFIVLLLYKRLPLVWKHLDSEK